LLNHPNFVDLARSLGGLPVYGCLPGSPAERAGVRYGDVLLSVDGHPTPSWDAYIEARRRSGPSIHLRLFRDGFEFEVDVVLDRSAELDATTIASVLGLIDGDAGQAN
jgi:C-terminal processing protease CtpA/Prc